MRGPLHFTTIMLACACAIAVALAKDNPAVKSIELPDDHASSKLKPGAGSDTTEANCGTCHSTDYMVRQPGGDARRWREVVSKMVKVYGAPVSDEDAKVIADYLGSAYPAAPSKLPRTAKPSPKSR